MQKVTLLNMGQGKSRFIVIELCEYYKNTIRDKKMDMLSEAPVTNRSDCIMAVAP